MSNLVTCFHHLNLTDFEVEVSCSIALQDKDKTGYPRVSRGFYKSGFTDFLLCCHAQSVRILFPLFMILTATFTSRSILFPHSQ